MPTHAEQRVVPFTQGQLFDLVADVARYPDFLPWCVGARIREVCGEEILADLMIGYKLVRERFTSRVSLNRAAGRIDVTYTDGPFKYLDNYWVFREHPDGCLIDFHVDFEFRSTLLEKLIATLFNEAVMKMVGAFEERAHTLYGACGEGVNGVTAD
ncbi:MAG: ubiquinone-binding protein [Rhodospirillaceae bacterium]|nr:ubiquinone-binding protein [Rhodospirillaceae bacterium]